MDIFTGLILFAIFLYLLYRLTSPNLPENFPPGPTGLPIIGNVLQLGIKGHIRTIEMAKKYGDVIGITFGSRRMVCLMNVDDIREAFGKPEFSGRFGYNIFLDKEVSEINEGVIMGTGSTWVDLRRFSLKTLRDFGFGKRSLETIIVEQTRDLIDELKKKTGQPISTPNVFNAAVLNIVWSIIAAKRFEINDPKLTELTQLVLDFMKKAVGGSRFVFFMFPLVSKFRDYFPFLFSQEFDQFRAKLFAFLRKTIQEHREIIELGNPRDFIDTYLEETMKATGTESTFRSDDDDYRLIVLLNDFFIAGSETTSTTLTWALFLLAMNEDAQEKLYKEIQDTVGSRAVTLADRANLHYTEATMTEIYRISSIVPFGVGHSTTQDVMFKGFFLPKNTLVQGNAYAAHFDTKVWGDPEKFRPQRHLNPQDKTFVRSKYIIPFSVGKRQCLGETLARDEFFLFLTHIVQNLKITMPADEPPHSIEGVPGAVQGPEPHKIILLDRNN